jgi:predicted Fe-Mo cluster-binding NifX family protein
MKIALPTKDKKIDNHFGHCEYFTIFTIGEEKTITEEKTVESPAGCGCKSNIVHTLSEEGVKIMLAGNMGDGAVNVLASKGIQVVRGCSGDVKTVAENWLNGNVTDSGIGCSEHEHDCGNH